jgi:YesN/AraC family two-component response regulator
MFKCTFMLEKIMNYICNKLGYENHHIFERVFKKKSYIFLLEPI